MDYQELYRQKCRTPDEIAAAVEPGFVMKSDIALAAPRTIVDAICRRAEEGSLRDVCIQGSLDLYPYSLFTDPKVTERLRYVSWFSNGRARKIINAGLGDIMPGHYHDFCKLIDDYLNFDAILAVTSPMDEHGYFSFGTDGSVTEALLRKSKRVFLEVNPHMPRCLHGPIVHISQVDMLCENDAPLVELPEAVPDEKSTAIGNLIAENIPDGACLQLGIGAIPDAVGQALKSKRHLGIHTEMLTSSMIDLIACGAVDNSRKTIHPGRTLATFAFGSKKIYDFIHNNPSVEILPASFVNDPYVICQNDNMISINSAVEVDLYGQVCAESVGTKHISGSGGQVDYVRGAVMSKGGKSFIAFESTANHGTESRIVPTLKPGAVVTTGKNEVDYVVTEYGVAKLRGKTIGQRVKALTSIAHPKFREELLYSAKKQGLFML